jgi:hypothetical protein
MWVIQELKLLFLREYPLATFVLDERAPKNIKIF